MTGNPRIEPRDDVPRRGSAGVARPPLSPERLSLIRERIREGAYDSDAVLEAVAHGILRSNDL